MKNFFFVGTSPYKFTSSTPPPGGHRYHWSDFLQDIADIGVAILGMHNMLMVWVCAAYISEFLAQNSQNKGHFWAPNASRVSLGGEVALTQQPSQSGFLSCRNGGGFRPLRSFCDSTATTFILSCWKQNVCCMLAGKN